MNRTFTFSKWSRIIIVIAIILTLLTIIAINAYQYREKIKLTFNQIVYLIKLPYEIAKLKSLPPDQVLLMPVKGVSIKDVEDTWGAARSDGRKHEGQDIFANAGTEILSATYGYVISTRNNELGGITVTVLGSGQRRYYYAHLERIAPNVKYLMLVNTSTVLGYVGNTGNAITTPPHLHFGVYEKDGAINPFSLIKDRDY